MWFIYPEKVYIIEKQVFADQVWIPPPSYKTASLPQYPAEKQPPKFAQFLRATGTGM